MKKGTTQDPVLGFRVSSDLMDRLDHLADLDRRKRSQLSRILMEGAVEEMEKALGVKPGSEDVAGQERL